MMRRRMAQPPTRYSGFDSFMPLFCGVVLLEILVEPHCAMEHPDDMHLVVGPKKVHDPVVAPQQNAQITTRGTAVGVADERKPLEDLGTLIDGLDDVEGVDRGVDRDVVVDPEEPALRFSGPDYLCQDSIRRPISSFEMVLPASESAMPRSTMTANASSRRISSGELSSGWSWINWISCALAGPMTRF
jgi:hypothetical protein